MLYCMSGESGSSSECRGLSIDGEVVCEARGT